MENKRHNDIYLKFAKKSSDMVKEVHEFITGYTSFKHETGFIQERGVLYVSLQVGVGGKKLHINNEFSIEMITETVLPEDEVIHETLRDFYSRAIQSLYVTIKMEE